MVLPMIGRSVDFAYNFLSHGGDNKFINHNALGCVHSWLNWGLNGTNYKLDKEFSESINETLSGVKNLCDLRKGCLAANDLIQMAAMHQTPSLFDGVKFVGNLATGMKATDALTTQKSKEKSKEKSKDSVYLNVFGLISGGAGIVIAANNIGLIAILSIASDACKGKFQLDAGKVQVIFTAALNIGILIYKTVEFAKAFFTLIHISIGDQDEKGKVQIFAKSTLDQLSGCFSSRVKEWVSTAMVVSGLVLSIKNEFYEGQATP